MAGADNKTVLIVGALGVVGRAAFEHFSTQKDWQVIGLSRRKPEFPAERWISADLADPDALAAALAGVGQVSHIVYAALMEEPELVSGWTSADQVGTNTAMLRNLLDALPARSDRHLVLLQGTKAYGVHHGPYRMPAREFDPRFIASNFYYDQEDLVRERATAGDLTFTVLRPQIVCGYALNNPMNAAMAIGVYAAICAELGQPMRFSGGPACFQEAVDAELLARAIRWACEEPRCAGETYNIANGDCFSWRNLWPGIARRFGAEPGIDHAFSMARIMPDKGAVWDRVVQKHGLRPIPYDEIVSSWQFLDYLLRYDRSYPHHSLVSTIKARQHGFHDCMDTEVMFDRIYDRLQAERILPARGD
jgi:nucleoside-diphosphate-sugar epimerase